MRCGGEAPESRRTRPSCHTTRQHMHCSSLFAPEGFAPVTQLPSPQRSRPLPGSRARLNTRLCTLQGKVGSERSNKRMSIQKVCVCRQVRRGDWGGPHDVEPLGAHRGAYNAGAFSVLSVENGQRNSTQAVPFGLPDRVRVRRLPRGCCAVKQGIALAARRCRRNKALDKAGKGLESLDGIIGRLGKKG